MQKLQLLFSVLFLFPQFQSLSFDRISSGYTLTLGRKSACPSHVYYKAGPSGSPSLLPATSLRVASHQCIGKGGKQLRHARHIRRQNLVLPNLFVNPKVDFVAAVETNTRICGPWSFNASAISWYVINNGNRNIYDEQTDITLFPGQIYLVYSHFADLCVFRKSTALGFPGTTDKPVPTQAVPQDVASESPDASNEKEPGKTPEVNLEESHACFPARAVVCTQNACLPMDQLNIGMRVLVNDGQYEPVYTFSHQQKNIVSDFVSIETAEGRRLSLSPGHYIYLNKKLRPAKAARIGHTVIAGNGSSDVIVHISYTRERGLYNPHTTSGSIIVGDVLVSTWTTAVKPVTASSFLSPLRFLYCILPKTTATLITRWLNIALDKLR